MNNTSYFAQIKLLLMITVVILGVFSSVANVSAAPGGNDNGDNKENKGKSSEAKENKEKSVLVSNRYVSTLITVVFGAALTLSGETMSIWPVFGSANQLLAALALLALTVWIANLKKNFLFTLIPMIFMFSVTLTALGMLIYTNFIVSNYFLSVISILLFTLSVILGIKAYGILMNGSRKGLSKELA